MSSSELDKNLSKLVNTIIQGEIEVYPYLLITISIRLRLQEYL